MRAIRGHLVSMEAQGSSVLYVCLRVADDSSTTGGGGDTPKSGGADYPVLRFLTLIRVTGSCLGQLTQI